MNKLSNYEKLLLQNKAWVAHKNEEDEFFFKNLSKIQRPEFLWIGCSDSRVSANQITDTRPGEIFVHRNIANIVIHTDMSMLSVLDYAVNVLEVNHVVVCGHYGCGGLQAALSNRQFGLIDNWVRHLKDIYMAHRSDIEKKETPKEKEDLYAEFNVIENVFNLGQTSIVQNAWQRRKKELWIHGWIYDLGTGLITDLDVSMKDISRLEKLFKLIH